MDGLRTGVDYDKLRLKWEGSKGPFYNALQQVFAHAAAEHAKASSDLNAASQKSGEAQQRVVALEARERKTEAEVKAKTEERESLEQQTGNVRKNLQKLNSELVAKKGLLNQADELEKMGFRPKQLQQLHETLVAIGTKRGLRAKEAMAGFFSDLEDYDAKVGFERDIQRLDTIAKTSRVEAKKWRAEKEALKRAYEEKRDSVNAMESLVKQGVKMEHILAWDRLVQPVGGVEELGRDIARYKSVRESVIAWEKEIRRLELLRSGLSGEVDALGKQRAETQGAVTIMSKAGIAEITATKDSAVTAIKGMMTVLNSDITKASEVKVEAARLERELHYARYLAANDEVLKEAPVVLAQALLGTVDRYFRLRGVNPRLPVPDFINRDGVHYSIYGGVPLADLIKWVATGLDKANWGDK